MKQAILIITFLTLTFTSACSPGATLSPPPAPTATSQVEQAALPAATTVPEQPTVQPGPAFSPSAPTASAQPTAMPTNAKGGGPDVIVASANPYFAATEILGRPTDKSVTVNVVPLEELEIYYEYGTEAGTYTAQTAMQTASTGAPLDTVIGDLQPNTRYYYRIQYRQPGKAEFTAGEEHTFITQRAPGSTFTFAIQGDSHPERVRKMFHPDLYARTLRNVAAAQPDFYLTIGDDFSVDTLKRVNASTVTQRYIHQRQFLGLVGSSSPIFLVNGNHEQAARANLDGTPDNVAVWAQNARNSYYPQPAPDGFYTGDAEPVEFIGHLRDYYAWMWGDALFAVIDPYWHSSVPVDNRYGGGEKRRNMWDITLGDEQYHWLKQTLEQSTAKYKFVFTHHVLGTGRGGIELAGLYEWGGQDRKGNDAFAQNRPGWGKPIHRLMADNNVTIFFQGHDHIFVRQELDGVIYQSLPLPADPNYALHNAEPYRSGDKLPGSGFVRVTVAPEGVAVTYIRSFLLQDEASGQTNRQVAYSYTIGQPGSNLEAAPTTRLPATATPTARQRGSLAQDPDLTVPDHAVDLILGRPTDSSITASVLAYQDGEGYIAFGTPPGGYPDETPSFQLSQGQPVEVRLETLQPDTQYAYQLLYRRTESGEFTAAEEVTFHTQRSPNSEFVFTVQADSHLDSNSSLAVYERTLANVLADQPDFHIDLGDTFMTDKYKPFTEAQQQYLAQRYYLGLVGCSAPLFLVLGNHDGESGGRPGSGVENMGVWSAQMRTQYFPNPLPDDFYTGNLTPEGSVGLLQNYYAWNWGNALFVVLDPYRFTDRQSGNNDNWSRTLGPQQYQSLQEILETSQARFKFVFVHQLVGGIGSSGRGGVEAAGLYEWGGHNLDGSWGFDHRPGWEKPIHQLLVENQVTALFHGHDHLFVKQELDGVVYQEVPQPSTARYDATGSAREYGYISGDVRGSPGHLRVTVSPSQVAVEYVRAYLPQDENSERRNGKTDYMYTMPVAD